MKTFRDALGQEWMIEVNVAALKRVRDTAGVDLTKLIDPESPVIHQLDDVFVLFDCLCAILQPQLDKHGLSAEEFGAKLDEDSTEKAATALFEAIIDFFREDRRMLLKRAFSKVKMAVEAKQTAAIRQAMNAIESKAFDREIARLLAGEQKKTSGSSSTASPES